MTMKTRLKRMPKPRGGKDRYGMFTNPHLAHNPVLQAKLAAHARVADPATKFVKPTQTGKKGGKFVLTQSGRKRHV